jgi:hypothetical protein
VAIRGNSFAAEANEEVSAPIGWSDTRRQYGPEPRALVVRCGEHPPAINRVSMARKEAGSWPLLASQSRAVSSSDAVSTRRPSGLKTALLTSSVWPWKMARRLPLSASQSRAVLSLDAVSAGRPSGQKDRATNVGRIPLSSLCKQLSDDLPSPKRSIALRRNFVQS